ncbi:PrsW family glutamic-type intramembrane protease [Pediococcus argentinicus]|uniref:PrsW family intramembrane metalloprotease n=1 Tax=Pediococcus argentinicus TaxID=480391 RepID=UPI00338E4DE9
MKKQAPVRKYHFDLLEQALHEVDEWTGSSDYFKINLKNNFAQVFKRHSKKESDEVFIAGTTDTTPALSDISENEAQPWLFARVFLVLFGAFIGLLALYLLFRSDKAVPGLIFIGSLMVPFSLLVFFFEMNAFKNISIFSVTQIFLIGGVLSLLMTMVLYGLIPVKTNMDFSSALSIGLIEETAKLIIVAYFIWRLNANFILNGLLIGAAIGAGFAVFETSGYAGIYGISTLFERSWESLGTHTLWSAISGASIVLAKEWRAPIIKGTLAKPRFYLFFGTAVLLHTCWDWNMPIIGHYYAQYWILIFIAWLVVLVLIHAGVREIKMLHQAAKKVEKI